MNKNCFRTFVKSQFFLLLALAFLATGCAGAAAAQPERQPLRVGWSPFPGFYPMAIALEQDLFARPEHQVEIEPVLYEFSEQQLADFESGRLDGAFFALGEALLLEGRFPDSIRLVLVTDNSDGADVIIAEPDIASVTDLRGKRVGVSEGSFGELLVQVMLESNGLEFNEVRLLSTSPDDVPAEMGKTINAGHTWEPFTSIALKQGYHVIFSSAQTPGLIPDVLVFRSEVVAERPEEVQAFIDAWFEAANYWQLHPAEGNEIIARYLELDPAEVSTEGIRLFDRQANQQAFIRSTAPTSLYVGGRVNNNFLIDAGVLSNAPNLGRLLDPSFVNEN